MEIAAFIIAIVALLVSITGLWVAILNRRQFLTYANTNSPLEYEIGRFLSERSGIELHKSGVAVLIKNPTKNRSHLAEKLIREQALKAGFKELLVMETTVDDPGRQMALDALAANADVVFTAGGDGTVRVVAEQLAGTGTPMGIIPVGTGNLLARNLEFNVDDLSGHCTKIVRGWVRQVDTMVLKLEMADGTTETRRSLVIAGVGADAMMIQDTRDELKAIAGWLAYGEAGLKQLVGKKHRISIAVDGQPKQTRKVRSVMFANVGQLQAGVNFVPDAVIDDGLFDVVVLAPDGGRGWFSVVQHAITGKNKNDEAIEFLQGQKVKLSVLDGASMPAQLDGDVVGEVVKITVEIDPGSLFVLVPHSN